MTHVLVLSAKVRTNERLWQTLDIGNMFGHAFGLKNSKGLHSKEQDYRKICTTYTSLDLAQNLLSEWLWVPLL